MNIRLTVLFSPLIFFWSISLANAETIHDAKLRFGAIMGGVDIPPVLIEGVHHRFEWLITSFVPLTSWLNLRLPDGTQETLSAPLSFIAQGDKRFVGDYSLNSYFHRDYTIPYGTSGRAQLRVFNAQDDGEWQYIISSVFPEGSVDRPADYYGKTFYRNICAARVFGNQCVIYVQNYFKHDFNGTPPVPEHISDDRMPGLCQFNPDCGAYNAYDHWNFGFGKGAIPKINSIMVIDKGSNGGVGNVGHMAVVVAVNDYEDGTWNLVTQESNLE